MLHVFRVQYFSVVMRVYEITVIWQPTNNENGYDKRKHFDDLKN